MATKIMIVDDDKNICELISIYLSKEGFETVKVYDGNAAIEKFSEVSPSLVVLDLMLPGVDGYTVCKHIRKISNVPIIMLTAKSETLDKVLGLELGADDYIVKPFDPKELVARVKAVLRRYAPAPGEDEKKIVYPGIVINMTEYKLKLNGRDIEVPPKEFELLYFLASHPNQVFTREQLLEQVWGYDYFGDSRTVDVHIKRLREKLPPNDVWSLKTVWGVGYKFEVKGIETK
ncbi:DNA-binding response regulator, OmpR family, contains REC and winged-helix (wHTH) domain [Caldanaerobius fijiensis DSM 17918]|uniref:Stage 0 sporulation protein A homolog n=1 Tax=Caldanaerobius fijiensis DSM 17918 TaxID=1121256 RepID=A0A1M5DHZ1_9THEO|nr:response regulator transcription factor [Caldanaerobius fijiensis]SHF66608.1 DNA-binding response regulator, OmpR family, contains REC and winged-helix (wHTH) domain [Caldanaerobius fijiensis DSM 17918]